MAKLTLKPKRVSTRLMAFLMLAFLPSLGSAEWGAHKEWMGLINSDCGPTLKGSAKRMFSEKSFWVEVNVSMSMWSEDMQLMRYEGFCYAEYQAPR
jgi:hypothetical protein